VTIQDVLVQYEGRLHELQAGIAQLRLPIALTAIVLAIAVGLFLALGLYAIRQQASFLWLSFPIAGAAASARRLRQAGQSRSRMWRLKRSYDRAVQRLTGNWAGSGVTGEEFDDPDHVYARDLHVLGEGSLFELLCIARTSIGQRGLANYLLEAPVFEETILRQDAVRELRGRVDLRERVAGLGEFEFFESKWGPFEDWLNSPKLSFARRLPIVAVITSALLAGIFAAAYMGTISWTHAAIWISPLVAFHSVTGLFFRRRVNRMLDWLQPVSIETRVLREGLQILEGEQFRSAKLQRLRAGEACTANRSKCGCKRGLNSRR
jgi:hypothetical protein